LLTSWHNTNSIWYLHLYYWNPLYDLYAEAFSLIFEIIRKVNDESSTKNWQ
jgi:hypothetical protein